MNIQHVDQEEVIYGSALYKNLRPTIQILVATVNGCQWLNPFFRVVYIFRYGLPISPVGTLEVMAALDDIWFSSLMVLKYFKFEQLKGTKIYFIFFITFLSSSMNSKPALLVIF